jgi:ABC-type amino acid transport substrate-binding protein
LPPETARQRSRLEASSFSPFKLLGNNRNRFAPFLTFLVLLSPVWLVVAGCGKRQTSTVHKEGLKQEPSQALVPSENAATTGSPPGQLELPTGFGKRTGDLDEMVKNRSIRALVIVNPIGFFYSCGKPQGIQYEALQEFEKFANQKLNTGKLPVTVVFLPMRPDQIEAALNQGLGDMIAQGIVITAEREQRVAFSSPIQKDVTQVVVTVSALSNVSSFDDLAGKAIYVNPLTTYYDNLKSVSDTQRKAGKVPLSTSGPPIRISSTTI